DPDGKKLNTGDAVKLGDATAEIGGGSSAGTLTVLDPKGSLWATQVDATVPVTNLAPVDPGAAKPVAKVGAGAQLAIGVDGVVHAVSPTVGITSLSAGSTGWQHTSTALPAALRGALQVSAVGGEPVV